ncbi:hypothetical protein EGH24_01605 [Halonotius terrestris]|uniref:YdbS-like PH domain-containing protein n=1 Tax=Halonotius terrestris TaxID=2487750 RepID=A0A8J8TCG7_9EURY|nr:PH domain-containing protein [Halonotius terrestris]TQQ83513.1 hypothetical protein EGH24_01605 [Halonotius terrestris]
MKLAPASIPYRVFQKAGRVAISLVFLGSIGTEFAIGRELVIAGVGVIILLTAGYELAYYRRFRYEFTKDTFDVKSGVLNRREREIPYGRIQNVDISRNVIQRLLGLSAVNLETAGGGSTEAAIKYVTAEAATGIQSELRERKSTRGDREPAEGADTDEATKKQTAAEDELLFEIAPSELALAGVLSFDPRVPGLLFAIFTGSIPFVSPVIPQTDSPAVLLGVGVVFLIALVVLSWLVGAASAIVNYWGFRLTRSPTELRYERGLLKQYSGTIPFDKIQTVTISDNPLKRQTGYATLAVETAGYAPGQANERGSEAAVPIASRDRIKRLAEEIDGCETVSFNRPPKRIRRRYFARYLIGLAVLTGVLYGIGQLLAAETFSWYLPLAGLVLAPIAAHYKWLHRGYALGEDHLITRNGVWRRETKRVAYHRIQTVIDERTIFQRRWSVATVVADTAGSLSLLGNDAAAVDIDASDAIYLRRVLRTRLQAALAERRQQRNSVPAAASTPTPDSETLADDNEAAIGDETE